MTHCRAPRKRQNYLMGHPKLRKLGPGQQGSRTRWQNCEVHEAWNCVVYEVPLRLVAPPQRPRDANRDGAAGFGKNEAQPCDLVTSVTGPLLA